MQSLKPVSRKKWFFLRFLSGINNDFMGTRRGLIIGLFILFMGQLHAQKNFFFDDFVDDRNEWIGDKNTALFKTIKDGVFTIENKKRSYISGAFHQQYLNTKYDFRIETMVKISEGRESSGFTVLFGFDKNNSYQFKIDNEQKCSVAKNKKGKNFYWLKSTKFDFINGKGSYNKLWIEKKGDQYNFYVNQKLVLTHRFEDLFGDGFGFWVDPQSTAVIDRLVINHAKPRINLVRDFDFIEKKKNLGSALNGKHAEIAPIISPDGNTLYMARFDKEYKSCNIWYSERKKDGSWSKAVKMDAPLNNEGDNVVVSVSPDGNTLIVEGVYRKDGTFLTDDGMSITNRTKDGWEVPKIIKINNYYNMDEHFSFSPTTDRSVLLMSVEREDTYGNKDLYVSFRNDNGTYSKPKNMGGVLNTNCAEGTPFIAPDGKTLYFSSQGHTGYGNNDIFVTKRLDDTWENWSEPKNLGPEINTKKWDVYYSVSARGDYAYLVSVPKNKEREDLYVVKLSEDARPDPVVLVKGKVLDKQTNLPIEARIVYKNEKDGKKVGEARSNPKTGEYSIILPYGKSYSFKAKARNYYALENEKLDLRKEAEYKEIEIDLYMVPLKEGEVVELYSVQFIRDKATLLETSFEELNELAKEMLANEKMKIELSGHTETRGNPEHLLKLSQLRVDAVKEYLVKKGVKSSHISGKGYGNTKPIARGSLEEEQRNRRVEMRITGI